MFRFLALTLPPDSLQRAQAFHNRVAALPALAARYEKVTEGPRLAYKVLP